MQRKQQRFCSHPDVWHQAADQSQRRKKQRAIKLHQGETHVAPVCPDGQLPAGHDVAQQPSQRCVVDTVRAGGESARQQEVSAGERTQHAEQRSRAPAAGEDGLQCAAHSAMPPLRCAECQHSPECGQAHGPAHVGHQQRPCGWRPPLAHAQKGAVRRVQLRVNVSERQHGTSRSHHPLLSHCKPGFSIKLSDFHGRDGLLTVQLLCFVGRRGPGCRSG